MCVRTHIVCRAWELHPLQDLLPCRLRVFVAAGVTPHCLNQTRQHNTQEELQRCLT